MTKKTAQIKETRTMTVRLPKELYIRVRIKAAEQDMSIQKWVEKVLIQASSNQEKI
jgi:predicted HicB family RNase H-like nuclease